jgi:hypothetical protein
VETGSHEELVKGLGLYYAMWRTQIGERDMPAPPVEEASAVLDLPQVD